MNYGETLTYWYLRLNGFIPMRNFVLHHENIDAEQSADADLLAIRFPHVYEAIGGRPDDWDNERFGNWGLDLARSLALIVEVKTGAVDREEKWWRQERIRAGVQRLGMFPEASVPEIVRELENTTMVHRESWTVAKLLVTDRPVRDRSSLILNLADADEFIWQRIHKFKDAKLADRLRFPDDLMQYLAWKVI
ncbi:MAG: hypothetical protein ACREDR_05420 [Blastocatellia bacterium]